MVSFSRLKVGIRILTAPDSYTENFVFQPFNIYVLLQRLTVTSRMKCSLLCSKLDQIKRGKETDDKPADQISA